MDQRIQNTFSGEDIIVFDAAKIQQSDYPIKTSYLTPEEIEQRDSKSLQELAFIRKQLHSLLSMTNANVLLDNS